MKCLVTCPPLLLSLHVLRLPCHLLTDHSDPPYLSSLLLLLPLLPPPCATPGAQAARSSAAPYAESPELVESGEDDGRGATASSAHIEKGSSDGPVGDAADGAGGGSGVLGADGSAREPGPAKPAAAGNEEVLKGMEGMSAGALVASFRRAQEERVALYRRFNG